MKKTPSDTQIGHVSQPRMLFARNYGRATALLLTAVSLGWASPLNAQTNVPADPAVTCSVSATEFNTWFQTGTPTLNGVVHPANSVTFPDTPNCSFYRWSEQMFLWLTSPAPSFYGGGSRIFDSPTFYDVSPQDQNFERTFIPHSSGKLRRFNLRGAKMDAQGLPFIVDKLGRRLQLERPQLEVDAKLRIRNKAGVLVEVNRAKLGDDGMPILMDVEGKAVERQQPPKLSPDQLRRLEVPVRVQRVFVDKIPVFLDANGNVVDVEQGQAGGGGALQAQNGSLVYYATAVNDVFAYFLTGVKTNQITPGLQFPTTQQDLDAITTFASAHGKSFSDPAALAVEVKSSWVEAASLPNQGSYITMKGTIPTYDTTNADLWIPNGQKTVLLAMVGMHVVGSAAGHPEMIWATFEHIGNAPSGAYSYINFNGNVVTVPQSTAGNWLFCANNAPAPFNVERMNVPFGTTNLASVPPNHIGPSNIIRWKAWGAAFDVSPNPISGTSAASNSEIISINNSVRGMLVAGDVRGNYIMTGATWTIGGAAPTSRNQVGTSQLANSTMETYHQGPNNTAGTTHFNCFGCHVTNETSVSHIFPDLQPLFR